MAPYSVALTGNVASGKTTVAQLFAGWGARVTDADAIVRGLQRPGTPVFRAMVARFGPGILLPDGTLDRPALRHLVLADPAALRDLNAIVHPAVRTWRAVLDEEAERAGHSIVVHDIPLLFEAADPAEFDAVVLVEAPPAVRKERLLRDRGFAAEEADRLISAQLPSEEKHAGSRFIIANDRDLATLEQRAMEVWQEIKAAAHSFNDGGVHDDA
jgi:dephospho-CoA kinase